MDYEKIEIDFVERTHRIIESYEGDYEITLLINCCIGLLVLPKEKHLNSIPDINIPEDESRWGLSRKNISGIKCDKCEYKLRNVIRRLRNGICHFNIKAIPNENGKIANIEIKDRNNFKATLGVNELKELTKSIAEHIAKTC